MLPPIAGVSCVRSQPRLPHQREKPGASSACCRACLRKACFLLRSADRHFFAQFPAPRGGWEFRQGTEPSPPARAAPGPGRWLQPGCGCKYSRLLLPEPISLQRCSARIDESPRCPCSCRRQQDPGTLLCLPIPYPTTRPHAPNPTAHNRAALGAHSSMRQCWGAPCIVLHDPGDAGWHLPPTHPLETP